MEEDDSLPLKREQPKEDLLLAADDEDVNILHSK